MKKIIMQIEIKKEFELSNDEAMRRIKNLKEDDTKESTESRESLMMYLGFTIGLPRELTIPITEHIHKFMKEK